MQAEESQVENHNPDKEKCECRICAIEKPFVMPKEILNAVIAGNLVVFAGAGISTESSLVFPSTFYTQIMHSLNLSEDISFSELMSRFCAQPNGRAKLLQLIKHRLDFLKSSPQLHSLAARFHRQVSTIPYIKDIITTNWDDLFEVESGATPIVSANDFAFWDLPGRKVYKIHGSINNYGSIVATKDDYQKCYRNLKNGLIGSYLRVLLATKVILFVGYSFEDEDFNRIYSLVKRELQELAPHIYIVTLDEGSSFKIPPSKATTIVTDATYFFGELKRLLVQKNLMVSDEIFAVIKGQCSKIRRMYDKLRQDFPLKVNPMILYSTHYLDGLQHTLECLLARKQTGFSSDLANVKTAIEKYQSFRHHALEHAHDYLQVAYVDGHLEGLEWFLRNSMKKISNVSDIDLYYIYGNGHIKEHEDYTVLMANFASNNNTEFTFVNDIVKDVEGNLYLYHHVLLLY